MARATFSSRRPRLEASEGEASACSSLSVDALKYNRVEQALADVARFIEHFNEAQKFKNPKYVAFGSSYSVSGSSRCPSPLTPIAGRALGSNARRLSDAHARQRKK